MNVLGEKTTREAKTELCWFCGQWRTTPVLWGETIGAMVYSSSICVSSIHSHGVRLEPDPAEVDLHAFYDGLKICYECVDRLASSCRDLPETYINEHLLRHELQLTEVANFDTGLMSWQDRVYPFGCWLQQFPDVNVRQRWEALDLATLYELGFRLRGAVSFDEPEFQQFVNRFCSKGSPASSDFLDHVTEHINAPRHLLQQIGGMRAVVFDVSIVLAQRHIARLDVNSQSHDKPVTE